MKDFNSKPDNNMTWAILSTIFCCLPLGIVSIINAAKVDGLYRSGDYEAAIEAANNSKKYAKWGALAGVLLIILVLVFEIFIIGIASLSKSDSLSSETKYDDPVELVDSVAVLDDSEEDNIDLSNISVQEAREAIEKDVYASNEDCPIEAEEGITITNIKMSGNYIVYRAECDEDVVSIQSCKMNKKSLKKEIISSVKVDNNDFINLLKEGNIGLIYKYVGNVSDDVCTIIIEPSDL